MQSAEMLQLRQRVIAACHIGPMDADETRGYVEHRLGHVGWKGVPRFDDGAYEAIHRVTGGIPRRINAVCDRVLLSGFLAGKRAFSRGDVEEVAREISEETFSGPVPAEPPPPVAVNDTSTVKAFANGPVPLRLDFELDAAVTREASQLIAGLQANEVEERLTRLERQANATLTLLQQLLDALRKPGEPGITSIGPRDPGALQ